VTTVDVRFWAIELFSVRSDLMLYKRKIQREGSTTHVEAESNTSTVTLRIVGGDEKGSIKYETVKYGRESQGTKDRLTLSSERAPHKNGTVTVKE
jgi:hypothetical protein